MKIKNTRRRLAVIALAGGCALGLTGYTAVNGKIIWKYINQTASILSPYSSEGAPLHAGYSTAIPAALSADLMTRIGIMLPESKNIASNTRVQLSDSDSPTNIVLSADAEIWVTFLNEGAGFLNSVGFFTYDPDHPPTSRSQVTDEQIILPNASIPPLTKAAGTVGATISLGKISVPAGTKKAVGFFLVANGWGPASRTLNGQSVPGVNEKVNTDWVFYSLQALNSETDPLLKQHAVLLNQAEVTGTDGKTKYQQLVLGFEDRKRDNQSDNDFNDVLLAVHVSPPSTIANLADIQTIVDTDPDTDGDGVKDSVDEFPKDATAASSRWFPSSSTWGTLAYEDRWPLKGDYDLNDIVVSYRSREILHASKKVSRLEMNLRLDARGGAYHSGLALALPGITPGQIKTATLTTGAGTAVTVTPLPGQTNAIFEIFKDAYQFTPNQTTGSALCNSYYNSGAGCSILSSSEFKLTVTLNTPADAFPTTPYDPFIFRTEAPGIEVHLPGMKPSGRADKTLFGSQDDGGTKGSTTSYKTATGLPWALNIPSTWAFPSEGVDVASAYAKIILWATSGGTQNTDWYVTPTDVSKTFRNGR